MAKSQASFSKKEKEKQKQQKKKEKEQRKEARKANSLEGKSFEDMIAYVDENGNISSTPPDITKKKTIKEEDIVIGSRNVGHSGFNTERTGRVTFFNTSKGYGFIKDEQTGESIFVHVNSLKSPIQENDRVSFEVQQGMKGPAAANVKKV